MSLKKNVIANYLGQGWTAMMGLVFIPVYVRYLGVEAWGLVGFMSMLQAWFALLDMGMTPTLSREMARFKAGAHSAQSIRDLLRSLEIIYGGVALNIVLIVWLAAPWIVSHWLKIDHLAPDAVSRAITVMGLVLAARVAEQSYRGAIQGLQHQVWLNVAQSVLATLRGGGSVVVLMWVSPTIEVFFFWQGFISILTVIVFAALVYRWLPAGERCARFNLNSLRGIGRFAGEMAVGTLLTLSLTQLDKVILSKLLPLEQFGYYMLAATVAGALLILVSPVVTAAYPRFTELATTPDRAELLADTYHRASQWVSVAVIPVALVVVFFSKLILLLWTQDTHLADETALLLSLLALGVMLNSFMNVPHFLHLAHGRTNLPIRATAVCILVPSILLAVPRYGALGAACVWIALNTGYVFIGMHFLHRKLLPAEKWRWYRDALAKPLLAGTVAISLLRLEVPMPSDRLMAAFFLVFVTIVVGVAVSLATPAAREYLKTHALRLRRVIVHG